MTIVQDQTDSWISLKLGGNYHLQLQLSHLSHSLLFTHYIPNEVKTCCQLKIIKRQTR